MEATGRRTDPGVEERLYESGYDFGFFQAVRMLGRLFPNREPVGRDALPSREIVRFGGHPSLGFPPSEIHEIKDIAGQPSRMTISFLGFVGRQGVLPLHYTEWLIRRRYEYRDTTAAAFLDLFLHRLVSLFYRAWEKHSLPVQYENAQFRGKSASELGLMDCLFDLVGAGTPGLREQLSEIEEQALIYYGGLIAQQPHSTIALESLLADFFQVPVSVEQFRGKWLPLDANEFSDMRGDEAQNTLGEGASLGDAVWHPQARIRVHIGPVTQTRFRALLPSESAWTRLVKLTRFFLDWRVDFDVQLSLLAEEVPEWRLSDEGPAASVLGLTTWLKTGKFDNDADDVILSGVPGKEAEAVRLARL